MRHHFKSSPAVMCLLEDSFGLVNRVVFVRIRRKNQINRPFLRYEVESRKLIGCSSNSCVYDQWSTEDTFQTLGDKLRRYQYNRWRWGGGLGKRLIFTMPISHLHLLSMILRPIYLNFHILNDCDEDL